MTKHEEQNKSEVKNIKSYHEALTPEDVAICDVLNHAIVEMLPEATSKVWHGHPVWFLDDNPIVGYSKLKDSVRMMFWSGQSFDESVLKPEGSFKAAEIRFTKVDQINLEDVKRCLVKARDIQWDYKNIVKRKGVLERLK
jgi:hypothetical protein